MATAAPANTVRGERKTKSGATRSRHAAWAPRWTSEIRPTTRPSVRSAAAISEKLPAPRSTDFRTSCGTPTRSSPRRDRHPDAHGRDRNRKGPLGAKCGKALANARRIYLPDGAPWSPDPGQEQRRRDEREGVQCEEGAD